MTSIPISAQEVFNQSISGIVAQGGPARDSRGHCKYRTDSGRKCAVGQVLTDEEYHLDMDNPKIGGAVHSITLPDRLNPHFYLLEDLQGIHDDTDGDEDLPRFIADAAALAVHHNLEMPLL